MIPSPPNHPGSTQPRAALIIRDEVAADADAITAVTVSAFQDSKLPGERVEPLVICGLRKAGALTLSLVAVTDGHLVGHVAFSSITISDDTTDWYHLGPVSVLPEFQGNRIGTALITTGLERLRLLGAAGCWLAGDPGYYNRFGFREQPGLSYEGLAPEVSLALSLDGHYPQGQITIHPAFHVTGA